MGSSVEIIVGRDLIYGISSQNFGFFTIFGIYRIAGFSGIIVKQLG